MKMNDKDKQKRNKYIIRFITKIQKKVEQTQSEQALFEIIDDIKRFKYPLKLYSTTAIKIKTFSAAVLIIISIAALITLVAAIILILFTSYPYAFKLFASGGIVLFITLTIMILSGRNDEQRPDVLALSRAIYLKKVELIQQLTPIKLQEEKDKLADSFYMFKRDNCSLISVHQGNYQGNKYSFPYQYVHCFYTVKQLNRKWGNKTFYYDYFGICLDFPSRYYFTIKAFNYPSFLEKKYTTSAQFNDEFSIIAPNKDAVSHFLTDDVVQTLLQFTENQKQANYPDKAMDINLEFSEHNQLYLYTNSKPISFINKFTLLEPDKFTQELKDIQPSPKLEHILKLAHDLMIHSNYSPELFTHHVQNNAK